MKNVLMPLCLCLTPTAFAEQSQLYALNDHELSEVNGQALLNLKYTDPSQAQASMKAENIGFYKLGIEANVEINANIKKLQLGCGGSNGSGMCDIDIDNLSLSGISDTREGRVGSSAQLTNPFVEFAIKNPESAATREVMGFRVSAEKALGMLTLGDENSGSPNGINTLSGALKIKQTTGSAVTAQRDMNYGDTNQAIKGHINLLQIWPLPALAPGFSSTTYDLTLRPTAASLSVNATTLKGTRMTDAKLTGQANIANLNFDGRITANLSIPLVSLIPLGINANGYISGLKANLDVTEDLGYIHKLPLNNPFSLSLQSRAIHWPGAEYAANQGWWLAIEDEIDIGKIVPQNPIEIDDDILKQVVPQISTFLDQNPPRCTLGSCLALGLNIGDINLSSAKPLYFPIKDLPLATQNFAPNCYGSLKIC